MSNDESLLGRNTTASAKELAVYFTARSGESRLGARLVVPRQVYAWYYKRSRTGFPADEKDKRETHGVRAVRVWDVERAWVWFRDYEPSKGGAPKGNQNAVRHGRCVGLRAAREARSQARRAS